MFYTLISSKATKLKPYCTHLQELFHKNGTISIIGCKGYCLINKPQQMVFRNEVIHTKHLNLLSFFICVLCHHKVVALPLKDTIIIS